MRNNRPTGSLSQRGYSLSELMVVVAIIGGLSLFTVPGFVNMYRSSKVKTSLSKFATDLRGARQRAATSSSMIRVSYKDGGRQYYIFESVDDGVTWTGLGDNPRTVEEAVFFADDPGADAFTDTIDDGALGDLPDIIFLRNGTARVPAGKGKVFIKANYKNIRNSYSVTVRTTGMVLSQSE